MKLYLYLNMPVQSSCSRAAAASSFSKPVPYLHAEHARAIVYEVDLRGINTDCAAGRRCARGTRVYMAEAGPIWEETRHGQEATAAK